MTIAGNVPAKIRAPLPSLRRWVGAGKLGCVELDGLHSRGTGLTWRRPFQNTGCWPLHSPPYGVPRLAIETARSVGNSGAGLLGSNFAHLHTLSDRHELTVDAGRGMTHTHTHRQGAVLPRSPPDLRQMYMQHFQLKPTNQSYRCDANTGVAHQRCYSADFGGPGRPQGSELIVIVAAHRPVCRPSESGPSGCASFLTNGPTDTPAIAAPTATVVVYATRPCSSAPEYI